jgi:DNA repair exonuclease SbcCD ATPase subunit
MFMEMTRLRAAVSTLTASNRELRDENLLLRNSVQRAREEPSYTYVHSRPGVQTPQAPIVASVSPPPNEPLRREKNEPSNPSAREKSSSRKGSVEAAERPPIESRDLIDFSDQVSILRAENAVLQRGLTAAKERLREQDRIDSELRAEVDSLVAANRFQSEDIRRLEEEVHRLSTHRSSIGRFEAEQTTVALHDTLSRLRSVQIEADNAIRQNKSFAERIQELENELSVANRRREEELNTRQVIQEASEVQRKVYETKLQQAQREMEKLHKFGEEMVSRCKGIAEIVDAQSKILEKKNTKIQTLQALHRANEYLDRNGETAVIVRHRENIASR